MTAYETVKTLRLAAGICAALALPCPTASGAAAIAAEAAVAAG